MDLNDGEAPAGKDRISNLPDSIIHHILSFLEIKHVAQTSVLSKQWKSIWTSVPILVFRDWRCYDPDTASLTINKMADTQKFMDFVDGTLLRRSKMEDIQRFFLCHPHHLNECRVTSWITNVISRNVQDFTLSLRQEESEGPFIIPVSLWTCASLVSLKLETTPSISLPKYVSLPNLKRLMLGGVQFGNECWNEKLFSKCPVLEELVLESCTYGLSFCISVTTLKLLEFCNWDDEDGLQDCGLRIYAPNLVSLFYYGRVAKEFFLPTSPELVEAKVLLFHEDVATREQRISYGTSVLQFLRGLMHLRRLIVFGTTLQALYAGDDLLRNLPTFRNTKELIMMEDIADKALIALLKATPNLESLVFDPDYPQTTLRAR